MRTKRQFLSPGKVRRVIVFLTIAVLASLFAAYVLWQTQRSGWTIGWVYVGMVVAANIINLILMVKWNPELIERRWSRGKWPKTWDKVWITLFALSMHSMLIVAWIDDSNRVGGVPGATWLIGYAVFVAGWALLIWAMVVNPFFEKSVRIQTEHKHWVIDTGPYAFVRHPGYVGLVGWIISTPLLLLSAWTSVPSLAAIILIVVRTALEDRTLRDELNGYLEYTKRVRSRLIPGIW